MQDEDIMVYSPSTRAFLILLALLSAAAPGPGQALSDFENAALFPVPPYEFGVNHFKRDGPLPPLGEPILPAMQPSSPCRLPRHAAV